MAGKDNKLHFLTLNNQGLRNIKTRKAIFRSFKLSNYDVIALQETYLMESDLDVLSLEWKGHFLLSEGTKWRKGLLILFNDRFSPDDVLTVFKSDRIISCILTFFYKKIMFVLLNIQ